MLTISFLFRLTSDLLPKRRNLSKFRPRPALIIRHNLQNIFGPHLQLLQFCQDYCDEALVTGTLNLFKLIKSCGQLVLQAVERQLYHTQSFPWHSADYLLPSSSALINIQLFALKQPPSLSHQVFAKRLEGKQNGH